MLCYFGCALCTIPSLWFPQAVICRPLFGGYLIVKKQPLIVALQIGNKNERNCLTPPQKKTRIFSLLYLFLALHLQIKQVIRITCGGVSTTPHYYSLLFIIYLDDVCIGLVIWISCQSLFCLSESKWFS